ncbi:MAG: VOC family protein [Thermaurantiacus tibetensis]|uniref:VOC family protein n=1 Tax=Thermaurantiacus tibetensis TaxID=2759035 RepID=UPI001F2BCFDC|nr:VOC family protein [Thermaurantiacus tibetensis]
MVGNEWSQVHRSPAGLGGCNTQAVHIQLAHGADLDAHCAQARAAGAEILEEPADQFYGDRVYRARDPEGHVWTVGGHGPRHDASRMGRSRRGGDPGRLVR